MSDFRLETGRLLLREMTQADYPALAAILRDPQVMYAYEHAFSPGETQAWLDRQRDRYALYGHGLWAVVLKETGRMIGQCGLTWQVWRDSTVLEVGYHLRRDCWGRGYATEAAWACIRYAFEVLGAPRVHTIIRDTNLASQAVARRCGLKVSDRWVKRYRGMEMPHLLFCLDSPVSRPQKQPLPLTVRQARPGDREEVERLTREAFWDVYRPGCSEPLLVHRLWTSPALVPELALVAQGEQGLAGSILFTRAVLLREEAPPLPVLSFGPLAVLPACQGKGVGQALIARGKAAARAMGYDAIVIFGDPDYYRRAGFIPGEMYGITDSRGLYAAALLACELVPGALDGCGGRFVRDPVFETDPAEAAAFDRRFPPRAAHAGLPSQRRFEMLAPMKRPRP